MISMSIRTNTNELMRREALSGRYGVRCFDFFGEGEDAIVTYPNWNRIEQFIENNKTFQNILRCFPVQISILELTMPF